VLALLRVAQLMVTLDVTVVQIALPSAQHALHFSTDSRQWVITAYALAFGSLLLFGGKLGDLFGRKWTLIAGLGGFAIASAIGGLAQSFGMLVAARAAGRLRCDARAVRAGALDGYVRGLARQAQGVWYLQRDCRLGGLGRALVGRGADAGAVLALVPVREPGDHRARGADRLARARQSAAPAAPAARPPRRAAGIGRRVRAGVRVLELGDALVGGDSDDRRAGGQRGGAGLVHRLERRAASPLVPVHIPWNRARGGAYLSVLLSFSVVFSVFLFLAYYMQQSLGFSPLKTGVAFVPMTGAIAITATFVQTRVLPRTGAKPIVLLGMALGLAGTGLLTRLSPGAGYRSDVLPSLILVGLGMGSVFAPSIGTATLGVQAHEAGIASALLNTSQQIGGSVGTALLSTIFASAAAGYAATHTHLANLANAAQVHGEATAFWWSAGIFALGLVVAAFVLPTPPGWWPRRRQTIAASNAKPCTQRA
jgi:MFS family permease